MLKHALLGALLVYGAMCNFDAGNIANENLGFGVQNLTCADDGCVGCFTAHFFQSEVLYAFEYATDPSYRIEFSALGGDNDWRFYYLQEDKSQPFRWCAELLVRADNIFGHDWRGDICFEDDMSGITVPPECPKPVMLVTLEGHLGDERVHGLQSLYCQI